MEDPGSLSTQLKILATNVGNKDITLEKAIEITSDIAKSCLGLFEKRVENNVSNSISPLICGLLLESYVAGLRVVTLRWYKRRSAVAEHLRYLVDYIERYNRTLCTYQPKKQK